MNSVPIPTSLFTSMLPPVCLTIPYTTLRPSPVPFDLPFVVKKRIDNLRQHLALDTGACVADPHDYIGALAARRESDNAAIP